MFALYYCIYSLANLYIEANCVCVFFGASMQFILYLRCCACIASHNSNFMLAVGD